MNDALLAAKLGLQQTAQVVQKPVAPMMPKGNRGAAPASLHAHAKAFHKAHKSGNATAARMAALNYAKASMPQRSGAPIGPMAGEPGPGGGMGM